MSIVSVASRNSSDRSIYNQIDIYSKSAPVLNSSCCVREAMHQDSQFMSD
jgi:hypothetical protein